MGCGGSKSEENVANPAAEPPAPAAATTAAPAEAPKPKKVKGQLTRPGEEVEKDLLGEALQKGLGAAPVVSDGKKGVMLSDEEKSMNGAPVGELFVVEVLPREKLQVAGNVSATMKPDEELQSIVLPKLTASLDTPWNEVFEALTVLRRVLVYNPEVVTSAVIESLVPGIQKSIRNSRSQLSKNAIFCAEDLFLKCGPELNLSQKACDALAGALLDTCASNMPKALRSAAATALEQGVITGPLMKLIPALAVKANAKNADVAEAAMVFTEKACKAVAAQGVSIWAKELDLGRLIPALSFGINAKSAKTKKAAKSVCVLVSNSISQAGWDVEVNKAAGLTAMKQEELKACAVSGPESSGPKKVDREAEAAERKKKLRELRAQKSTESQASAATVDEAVA